MQGVGFRCSGFTAHRASGLRVWGQGLGFLWFEVLALGFGVIAIGLRVWVCGLIGFRV